VRDGKIVAKFYNEVAGRPYPPIGKLTSQIVVQMNYESAFNSSSTVPSYLGLTPTLSSFNGYSNYTALFDQYRIEQLEVWMEPVIVPTTNGNTLATCVDLDDANTPTAVATVTDHPGALVGLSMAARYHKWVPHVAVAAYSGTFASFTNAVAPWIDSASSAVQHYGFKVACASVGTPTAYLITVRARVAFRAPGIQ
jgi:hypothetical protein